ncbi:hypothetical protein Dsin_003986, partial [Dipteronia sinensis]
MCIKFVVNFHSSLPLLISCFFFPLFAIVYPFLHGWRDDLSPCSHAQYSPIVAFKEMAAI